MHLLLCICLQCYKGHKGTIFLIKIFKYIYINRSETSSSNFFRIVIILNSNHTNMWKKYKPVIVTHSRPFFLHLFEWKPLNFIKELRDSLLCYCHMKGIYVCPRLCQIHDCHDCDICLQVIMNLSVGLWVKAHALISFLRSSHPQEHVSIKARCLRYVSASLPLWIWVALFLSWEQEL